MTARAARRQVARRPPDRIVAGTFAQLTVLLALAATAARAGFDFTDVKALVARDWSAAAPRARVSTLIDDKGEGWLVEVTDSTLVVRIDKGDLEHWAKREPWEAERQPFLTETERQAEERRYGADRHWRSKGWLVIPRDRVRRLELNLGKRKDLSKDRAKRASELARAAAKM